MDQIIKIIVLALIQGATEPFPVSSLGHAVIIPSLLGWSNLVTSDSFLPILVMLHLGTAIALLTFYWRDWVALVRAFFKTVLAGRLDADPQGKTIWLVIVGTIPVGILGLVFQKPLQTLFFSAPWPLFPAAFLCLNGAILYIVEHLRQRVEPANLDRSKQEQIFKRIDDLTFLQAAFIGLAQAAALLPGISRSGITMAASLRAKMSHEEAAHFTFLLLTPVILATALLEVPKLFHTDTATLVGAIGGGVLAGITSFLSVKFLTRYFKVGRLTPFAWYCLSAGLISFLIFVPLSQGWFKLPW